jgi:hypothetical protein
MLMMVIFIRNAHAVPADQEDGNKQAIFLSSSSGSKR